MPKGRSSSGLTTCPSARPAQHHTESPRGGRHTTVPAPSLPVGAATPWSRTEVYPWGPPHCGPRTEVSPELQLLQGEASPVGTSSSQCWGLFSATPTQVLPRRNAGESVGVDHREWRQGRGKVSNNQHSGLGRPVSTCRAQGVGQPASAPRQSRDSDAVWPRKSAGHRSPRCGSSNEGSFWLESGLPIPPPQAYGLSPGLPTALCGSLPASPAEHDTAYLSDAQAESMSWQVEWTRHQAWELGAQVILS